MNAELVNVFENWSKELSYRGTNLINRDESGVRGFGFKGTLTLFTSILALDRFSISFKLIIDSNFTSLTLINESIDDSYIRITQGYLVYRLLGVSTPITIPNFEDNQLYEIKVLRLVNYLYVYIDGELVGSDSNLTSDQHNIYDLIFINSAQISDISINVYDQYLLLDKIYRWRCNEGYGLIVHEDSGFNNSTFSNITLDASYDGVWVENDLFNNVDYNQTRGELQRLLNKGFDELVFELVNNSELGLCFGTSSPMSREASFVNFNKAYEKGVVTDIYKYPFYTTNEFSNNVIIYNEYLRFIVKGGDDPVGINVPLVVEPDYNLNRFYRPSGLIPFIPIPVCSNIDNMLGYEISFVIRSSEDIELYFGILGYNEERLPITDPFIDHTLSSSSRFLSESSLSLCNGRDLLIRAVLSTTDLVEVSDKLNINIGTNLIILDDKIEYIVPIISFRSVLDCNVDIKDIVVRPLEIDTQKGFMANKNKIFGIVKNNSGKFQDEVTSFIEERLIPVNCDLTLKYL